MRSLALVFAAGCYVSADVGSIQQTLAPETFPGAGPAGAGKQVHHDKTMKLDIGKSIWSVMTELDLRHISIAPISGVSKMDFVSSLSVTTEGDSSLPRADVAHFERGMPLAGDGSLAPTVTGVDLLPYVMKGLPLHLELDVTAPAQPWSLSIDIDLHAESDGKISP